MNLTEMLNKLPKQREDGTYYELRKQDVWLCVKTNWRDNTDGLSRLGQTPEEAVFKMLVELGIEKICKE